MTMTRIEQEKKTVSMMIGLYCRRHHGTTGLCDECKELEEYAHHRLDRCKFGEAKTSCRKCSIHCYKPAMREAIAKVMRYSGPRMLLHHPVTAVRHLIENF